MAAVGKKDFNSADCDNSIKGGRGGGAKITFHLLLLILLVSQSEPGKRSV